ncbi:MAG: restriction endonuclease subunit S [Bacteroidales bacterium]|nr:restriction endonuclease subunit S [Candidatus Colicola coprequi]
MLYPIDESILNVYYLKYALETIEFGQQKSSVPNINANMIKSLSIPVPPLPVQEEIVRILDNFSLLSAELEAELEGRRKQYDFYRTLLLDFSEGKKQAYEGQSDPRNLLLSFDANADSGSVQWKALGDIATFKYGYTDKAKDKGAARYIRITDIDENGCLLPNNAKYIDITEDSKPYLLSSGDIVVARTGATFGKTLYYGLDEQAIYASFLIKIELNDSVLSRYYWHFSKSKYYWEQANKYVSKAGQQQFNSNAICKIEIPIPSLAEQQRIVDILDRFDTLTNDLSQGLPAEIEARKKQYEHYRDKLLTFKRKGE